MKFRILVLSLVAAAAFPQQAAAPPAPDTVLAILDDGRKITYGEIDSYFTGLGEEAKKNAFSNRAQMIKQYALFLRLIDYAKAEKLAEKSPYREAIASATMTLLAQAAFNDKSQTVLVTPDDQKKFYAENKDRYTEAKVQVIYLGFVADPAAAAKENPGKTYRTQEEAKAKIEEIRSQAKSREDFVRLAKEFSEDETSKNNNGDFGLIRKSDNVPPDIKQVIFSMKAGEVSGPVLQKNGFYLFRIDELKFEDYDAVKDSIFTELKNKRANAWVEEQQNRPIQIVDKAFFGEKPDKP
jgi:parvulin-like peptidyl-prolyl isomerase